MAKSTNLTPQYVVSAALSQADIAALAGSGFKSVINFRPDGEATGQISSDDARASAEAAGLGYAHIPVTKHDLFADDTVALAEATLAKLAGPVIAYCASGQRAAIVWAAVAARSAPVSEVLETLRSAGFDFNVLRDDLEAQADRARWSPPATHLESTQPETESAAQARAEERAAA